MLQTQPIDSQQTAPGYRSTGLKALIHEAAFAPLDETGFIEITGDDRVRWLNGMATNSIQALKPGEGCYNFFLSAQGRIQGDGTAWMLDDSILLETAREQIPVLMSLLDRFIIMDDVELKEFSSRSGLQVAGPDAAATLQRLGIKVEASAEPQIIHKEFHGEPFDLIHAYSPLVPRFELWAGASTIRRIVDALSPVIPLAMPDDFEQLRLLEGRPRYGIDIRDRELPQETAQSRALHFAKGCYLGQEIVERIRSRGNVHRVFTGFTLAGEIPAPGTPLYSPDAPEKAIGEITSASRIADRAGQIAGLGYIRREVLECRLPLTYSGGTATSCALPFPLNASQA